MSQIRPAKKTAQLLSLAVCNEHLAQSCDDILFENPFLVVRVESIEITSCAYEYCKKAALYKISPSDAIILPITEEKKN